MTDLWEYLKSATKPIVLYGMGNGADKVLARLNLDGVKISGVFSSAGFKKNKVYNGFNVMDYETLKEELGEMIILVCFGSHLPGVIQNIKLLALENELYVPDVPVSGDVIFDLSFAQKHKSELEKVYDMLADELSKKVFENTVKFKLTGKPEYLFETESDREEVFSILNLKNKETFLDLGAFTGDTVEEFTYYCQNYDGIVAIEPDKRNFRKLKEFAENIKNITCINAAVSDEVGEIYISANHGRGNSTDGKMISVNTLTINELCSNFAPSFIKMDVEGNELRAIKGGEGYISSHSPKMHIACYHTPFDIFEIPIKISKLVSEYKIYMRHHPCLPAWDINYIFVR